MIYNPSNEETLEFVIGSSQIEGEYSQLAYDDHLEAWNLALEWGSSVSLKRILNCHKILQKNLRPDIAGKIRDVEVTVGYNSTPHFYAVPNLMVDWLMEYDEPAKLIGGSNVEEIIKRAHVEFEKIHPFEDGNGRVGRIILNWHRIMNGFPLFVVTPGESQKEYYKWFNE